MKQMPSLYAKHCLLAFLAGLLCLLFPTPVLSDTSLLNQAFNLFKTGNYTQALQVFDQVPESDRMAAAIGATRVRIMIGDYPAAEQTLRQLLSGDPENEPLLLLLSEVLGLTGRSDEAIQVLEPMARSQTATVCSMVQSGKLLDFRGKRSAATDYFQQAVSYYDRGLVFDAREVACVAEAFRSLGRFQDANSLLREAVRIDPGDPEIQVLWGDLFADKYNFAEARQSYQQVLEKNSRNVPALVGMARVSRGSDARALLEKALEINPRHAPARVVLAGMLIEDRQNDAAEDQLHQALAINPESADALVQLATLAYLNDDQEAFVRLEQKMAALSPGNGQFYARVAEACGRNYRFEQAVALAEKAVALDPGNWNGHIVLGMNLLRLGREEQGRAHLEIGFRGDPFHVWAMNMLSVLDMLDGFETRTSEHFVVRMHPMDAAVLWPYLKTLLEESWQHLSAKYGQEPRGPILIEVFPQQEDFAVRTSGLPNIGHLLGVCFGSVITLTSPKAHTPPGSVNWQEVVWHEFTHVVTLQMTNNRLPRWISEGVSVFEEGHGRPEWGRRQDLDLIRAVQDNRLIGINELDAAFSKAENLVDLNFAYYEASLLVQYIVERYGFDSLKTLIRRYAGNIPQSAIFKSVIEVSTEDLESDFFAWLKARVQEINIFVDQDSASDWSGSSENAPGENPPSSQQQREIQVADLKKRIEAQPRDFLARLQLGLILYAEKDFQGAIQHLTVARALLPSYSASPNPRQILAAIYEQRGDTPAMIRELEGLAKFQQDAFGACFKLGQIAAARNEYDRATYFLERAIAVNPYDLEVHRLLGAIALQRPDYPRAVREFEALLALDETDPALANTNLAEAHLREGDKARAKRYALTALEIAPLFERAQDILLDAIEP